MVAQDSSNQDFPDQAIKSKQAYRHLAATKPIIEKLRDLDALRDAAILLKKAKITKPAKNP